VPATSRGLLGLRRGLNFELEEGRQAKREAHGEDMLADGAGNRPAKACEHGNDGLGWAMLYLTYPVVGDRLRS